MHHCDQSFLHNRLGGLQVMVPGTETWQYVKVRSDTSDLQCGGASALTFWAQPIPGHAICNLGDAMSIYSGGILRSNLHRVV